MRFQCSLTKKFIDMNEKIEKIVGTYNLHIISGLSSSSSS